MSEFFGKYRGTVKQNLDPMQIGRVQVAVPAVLGESQLSWAMPSAPFAGPGVGFFAIPPVGANVWVEFEAGNPEKPIWSGCFWDTGDVPASPAVPQVLTIKTDSCTLTLNDLPGVGGITIELSSGMKISMTATALEITNGQGGKISMTGPKVSVNDGALDVT